MPPKTKTAIATRAPALLSGQAQQIYNHSQDLKLDLAKVREKRMNALLKDGDYAKLKKSAQEIVKKATKIQNDFDNANPEYKKDMLEITDDLKANAIGMTRIVVEAIRKNVSLEVYHGVGKTRRKLRMNLIAHPTLF